ncbi:MAG: lamin tail domain-containing protein [Sedimentisphaerales bacterium]|nr:lamin tail domain-containing protein [Sedimentisphaerales bacterium]
MKKTLLIFTTILFLAGSAKANNPYDVVISEIMYHPFHAVNHPENTGEEYIELYNRGFSTVNLSGWEFGSGVDFVFPDNLIIGAGEYLVIASNIDVFTGKYPQVNNVIGGWEGQLSNSGEKIELRDNFGRIIDTVEYADEGDWTIRELGPMDHEHRGWQWSDSHDGGGKSLELINPFMPNEYGGNWAASGADGGTPGTVNSVNNNDIAPLILDMEHYPIIPGPDDEVTVTAEIIDELNGGISVTLYYRVDISEYEDQYIYPQHNPADYNVLQMFDDGAHDDGSPSDGIYSARIPAQADGTIIEFYVEALDTTGNSRTWPAPSLVDGIEQQVTNALYQVDGQFDPEIWIPGSQPIYYLIITEAERGRLADIGNDGDPWNGEGATDAQMNATFISVDGVDIKLRYGVGIRNRGNQTRTRPANSPMNYRVNFRNDRPWKDVTAINLNSKFPHLQLAGSLLFQLAGLPAANATAIQVRVNGENLALSDYDTTYGSYVHMEVYDSDWAANHFPDDDKGNLYRCTYVILPNGSRIYADLDYKEKRGEIPNPDDYRGNYPKRTNASQDDYSDLFYLIDKLNNPDIPDDDFVSEVATAIDVEKWLRFIVVDSLLGNKEGGLATGSGDDFAMYRGIEDPRFLLMPHDLDTILGHSYEPDRNIFTYDDVDGLDRLLHHPDIIKLYYQQYEELTKTVFAPENIFTVIDELLGDWVPDSEISGNHGIQEFLVNRIDSILSYGQQNSDDNPQIPQQFSIECDLTFSNGFYLAESNLVNSGTIYGTANAINTCSVTVNSLPANWSQKNGTWSNKENILLEPGINRVTIRAFDGPNGSGTELEQGYIDIWYDTGSTNDYPKGASDGPTGDINLPDENPELTLNLITRDSYLPGVPVLIRIEILTDHGNVHRDIWNAVASLSIDNPNITMSQDQVVLYNGLGSSLVTFTGNGDFTLTIDAIGLQADKTLADWSGRPINTVSGTLNHSAVWSGVYHITGGDFLIPDKVNLTLNPGALVLIDGVPSGTNGTDINVEGSIQSLGTAESPITFTAYTAGQNWGKLYHDDAELSFFLYTNITQAGHSPHMGHSNSGPTIQASNSTLVFNHANFTDNAGKTMNVSSGCDLTFHDCLLARSVMGPEISGSAILFEDSWITEMRSNDDGDGIYIHSQEAGQSCILRGGVSANMDDDGIDLLGAEVTIEDFIVRDCKDKGISSYGGQTNINNCLVVENNRAPEDPTVASIAAKAYEGETAVVNIDHTTIVTTKTEGTVDIGIQSHNKYGVQSGTIIYNITNSIIDATDPVDVQAPYIESDIQINYSNVFNEAWPGTNNINTDPLFVDRDNHNYRLTWFSPCIDAGDPSAGYDLDGTITDQGYYRFVRGTQELSETTLTEDTIWTSQEGPYHILSDLIVPPGITLTIMPGTTVFFEPDTGITINGTLIVEGSQNQLIRFTRSPGTSGTWNGLQFADTVSDNRISYAVLEYGQTDNGMIGLINSRLSVDYSTFDHSALWRIRTTNSSLAVRNSVFTDMMDPGQNPTDNRSEHILGSGIMSNGRLVIENNIFGKTPGHNDAIDLDRAARPGPIPQILYNMFTGGGDEALDLEADAHIEGNIFMHYHKDVYNKDPGESNVISLGSAKNLTVVRNIMYDVDHVILVKENSFVTFVNNTIVDADKAVIYFDLPGQTLGPGLGANVNGCIFWNNKGMIFDKVGPSTQLTVSNSIIPLEWHYLGAGNIDTNPLFADEQGDFRLRPDSKAINAGPWSLDMGAMVPAGAAISGEPNPVTYLTNATLIVGGPGITHYKYSINNPTGLWSEELPVDVPIELNNLLNKNSYTIYAIGKNSAGLWQSQEHPTASKTWTVDVAHSELLINEISANTAETESDMIELYYDGPAPLDLADMSLSDDPGEPRKFVFSSSFLDTTIMNPGDYLILYGDHLTDIKNHIGFALKADGEGLYLYGKRTDGGNLIDAIEFGTQIQNYSIGRVGYDKRWTLNLPTPGLPNTTAPAGDPDKLKINEWLANGEVLFDDDFIELYNPNSLPVDLSGMYLTDNPVSQPEKHRLPLLSFIAPEGYAVFKANEGNQSSDLNFKLSANGEMIGLFDKNLNMIDQIFFGPQTTDVSQGRAPDGSSNFEYFELPTPGIANTFINHVETKFTLVSEDADKLVFVPTESIDDNWKGGGIFDDTAWMPVNGEPGGVGYERNSGYENLISLDIEDLMYHNLTTFYVRIPFIVDINPDYFKAMSLRIRYDDGFVAYLNGTEIARRNFTGDPAWNSHADGDHEANGANFDTEVDISEFIGLLRTGDNILAIHGLNDDTNSSDLIISAELEATAVVSDQEYPFSEDMEVLAGLRVTELMYHAAEGEQFDYIELQNINGTPINLNGVRIEGGIQFTFPNIELASGEYVLVVSDSSLFNGMGLNIAGEYNGKLSNKGEDILVRLARPLEAAVLRFNYNDNWYPTTDGEGLSLEIIDPAGHPAMWNEAQYWQPATPNPGSS